jgi:hypothetical protein
VPSPSDRLDVDIAARLLCEAIDHRQAEARALADFLGGEERIEHLGDRLGVMPDPVSMTMIAT